MKAECCLINNFVLELDIVFDSNRLTLRRFKMKLRMKSVVFGIIIGILTTASITVLGISLATPRVEVWLQDQQVSIMVDGRTLERPAGTHILNFNDRIHVPARFIAESLGATVTWDERSQTVIIVSADNQVVQQPAAPTPPAQEPPAEETPEPAPPRRHYSPLPVRRVIRDIAINVTHMEFYLSQTEVVFDLDTRSQWPIMFLREYTFIEFGGVRYPVYYFGEPLFRNSLPVGRYEREGIRLIFEPLPEEVIRSGDEIEEIRLVIGIDIMERIFADDPYRRANFDFHIDATHEPFFNFIR